MRTKRTLVSSLATAACILLGVGAALPSHAQAFDVFAGYDLFETQSGTTFLGTPLKGVPVNSYNFGGVIGTQNVGTTDTIVQRLNNAGPSVLNGTAPTSLQMNFLDMVTTAPTTFGGALPLNTYYIFLNPASPSTGTMNITYLTAISGTFQSSINVNYMIGTAPNDPSSAVTTGSSTLTTPGPVNWSDTAPLGALQIPGVNLNLNGSTINNDFWPNSSFVEDHPAGAHHIVNNAVATPEPGSLALVFASASVGLGLLRRRRSR